jgi:tRNA(Ile)-lysidine synthase
MHDLETSVQNHLGLADPVGEPRRFMVSVSGGMDSMLLWEVMSRVCANSPHSLKAIHFSYGLRAEESAAEVIFLQRWAAEKNRELQIVDLPQEPGPGVQERVREARLNWIAHNAPDFEWLEAHHQDDQIETFLFRLFRGVQARSLGGMESPSMRQGTKVWRPFLGWSRASLFEVAKEWNLKWCEDTSNQSSAYDRNFIRHKIWPLIEERFPQSRTSLTRLFEGAQQSKHDLMQEAQALHVQTCRSHNPWVLAYGPWAELSPSRRRDLFHHLARQHVGVNLDFEQICHWDRSVAERQNFAVNGPRDYVFRGNASKGELWVERRGQRISSNVG